MTEQHQAYLLLLLVTVVVPSLALVEAVLRIRGKLVAVVKEKK